MAHEQWGEEAYRRAATNLLDAIAQALVRSDGSLRLGDWNGVEGQTRPSDFMTAQFRCFFEATGAAVWTNVERVCYGVLEHLQVSHAAHTGLIPDFAVRAAGDWQPAGPRFLESDYDGDYFYNACRVPWRVGLSVILHDDPRARTILERFMAWATARHARAADFGAGYRLDGADIPGNDYDEAAFIAPTGVGAASTAHPAWLDQAWAYTAQDRQSDYYGDSLSLLCLMTMSGNFWLPRACAGPWCDAAELGGGWKRTDWFGTFWDSGAGWIYHAEHGWMYPVGSTPAQLWFYTFDLGWIWSGRGTYPWVYRVDGNAWLYFFRNTKPRAFWNATTNQPEWH
jgi:hypothetical protein